MTLPSYPAHVWDEVTLGESGDRVWRLVGTTDLYIKVGSGALAEAERIVWFAAHGIPVPEVVDAGDGFVVTTALPGRPASDPWSAADRPLIIDAIAEATRQLHTLDIAACPFDRSLAVTVAEAHDVAARNAVDLDDVDAERAGWSAAELAAALVSPTGTWIWRSRPAASRCIRRTPSSGRRWRNDSCTATEWPSPMRRRSPSTGCSTSSAETENLEGLKWANTPSRRFIVSWTIYRRVCPIGP